MSRPPHPKGYKGIDADPSLTSSEKQVMKAIITPDFPACFVEAILRTGWGGKALQVFALTHRSYDLSPLIVAELKAAQHSDTPAPPHKLLNEAEVEDMMGAIWRERTGIRHKGSVGPH